MATTERPPSRIGKKINPAYTAWRRSQKAEPIAPKEQPAAEPEILSLRCVKLARNTSFVICGMSDGTVGVKVKRGMGPKLLKKTLKVRKEGETYIHVP